LTNNSALLGDIGFAPSKASRASFFLDVTRICTRVMRSAPTGIDRVEFAYLAEAMKHVNDIEPYYILTAPKLAGALRDDRIKNVFSHIERAWGRHRAADEDAVFADVKRYLESPPNPDRDRVVRFQRPARILPLPREMIFPVRDVFRSSVRLRRRLRRVANNPAVYFHSSHIQLETPERFAWLAANALPSVFLIHDVIPIDFPEFCSPGARERHLLRLLTVSKLASLVIVNSNFTGRSLAARLEERGWRVPPIGVAPLGVDEAFLDPSALTPPRASHPYVVCVGTIEPRKNLAFLLAIWRRLVERLGRRTPRLVIAGNRGWENENVIDHFERSSLLAPFVIEVSDLSDAGLASTIAGAECLVAPSLVEGFSLPVVEAFALGVPVIASDISAHREIAEDRAILIDPLDGPAWMRAIEAICDRSGPARAEATRAIRDYRATTWPRHVADALEMIVSVAKPMR